MPLQDDYQVRLSSFEGPLDLLLFLVRRAEVDINDIPVARIADEYLSFLDQVDSLDIDLAGEFLVMAATLVEIKSRVLAPPVAGAPEEVAQASVEQADPRYELVQQLVAYQRFRTAADLLERMREAFARRHPAGGRLAEVAEEGEPDLAIELEDANVIDLMSAYERIVAAVDFSRLGEHRVEYDDTPIALHEEDLVDRLGRAEGRRMTLQQAFEGRNRGEMLGLFLALLELARKQRVTLVQEGAGDPIVMELAAEEAVAA